MIDEKWLEAIKLSRTPDSLSEDEVIELFGTLSILWRIARAAQMLESQFKAIRKDHDEKLGKSFKEACENWNDLKQGPLEFGPLMEALSALPPSGGEGKH